ncbi:unnamed protein product [Withania somnifera]
MAFKMNSLFALTKSPSSLTSTRVTINPMFHIFSNKFSTQNTLQVPQNYSFATSLILSGPPMNWVNGKFGCSSVSVRGFHASGFCLQAAATAMAVIDISKLGISEQIVLALAQRGITSLFPIQKAVLEPAMQGSDMIGRARTGTGKTLAFGIPIMDKIISFNRTKGRGRNPLALILAPTRELARQVDKEFYESAPVLDTLCVYGGAPISRQLSTLDRGTGIVVGTPGRIIDLLKRGSLNLSEIQFVVLDEADQMLNVGFAEDVETILENVRQKHQTMMFSATMPSWILKLTKKFLKKPVHVDLVGDSDQKLADGISLYSIACDMRQKPAVLGPLIAIFVHRSGQTGRAGKKGSAILMHSLKQLRDVKGIEHDAGCRFTELPTIKVEAGAAEMYTVMSRDVGRGTGGAGSGRSRGGFSGPSSGCLGKFGGGSRDTQGSKRLGGVRNFRWSGSSKGSNWSTNFAEGFGSGHSRRFGDSDYDQNNRSSRFDGFGDGKDSGEW